jgi:CubicO group peptidase (beta-lactamase class C family)
MRGGETVFHYAAGHRALEPVAAVNALHTIYDLASLTKAMATGTVLMAALDRGALALDDRVAPLLCPNNPQWAEVSVRHLAGHSSGLPAWRDLNGNIRDMVLRTPFEAPVGERALYSDLGYLALGWYLEARLGAPLDALFADQQERFGATGVTFCPPFDSRIAPTESVAGHAGLFGTAQAVAQWAGTLVDCWQGRSNVVSRDVLTSLWRPAQPPPRAATTWRLCFDTPSPGASSSGTYFGPGAVGHLGFTGCSLWIEPDREWIAVLLSNRVHPGVGNHNEIKGFRPEFHDLIVERFLR